MATKQAVKVQEVVIPGPRKKPPKGMMKVMNPIIKAVLASPLRGKMGKMILVIYFTGRKSGKQYSTPVAYHRNGDNILLFTHSVWAKNLHNGAAVSVLVDGTKLRGIANATNDTAAVITGVKDYLANNGGAVNAGRIGIVIPTDRELSEAEWQQAVRGLTMVPIKITGKA